ncbi:MAG: HIT domain-containing protein [Acidobacteriota bacterium]|jgi:ATP adenylyltransferase
MEHLFTPWRLEYLVSGVRTTGCVFCEALAAADDRSCLIVLRSALHFVILNRYPYNNGHLMIVPNRHLAHLHEATPEELHEMMDLASRCERSLRKLYRPHGINLGMNLGRSAGAGITEHYHLHLVPRWAGDTNFMTAIGETRLLPEELDQTWTRLRGSILEA